MSAIKNVDVNKVGGQISADDSPYHGYTLRNTSSSDKAHVDIFKGTGVDDTKILDTISLNPNESWSEFYPVGLDAVGGIFVSIVAGTVKGSVRVG